MNEWNLISLPSQAQINTSKTNWSITAGAISLIHPRNRYWSNRPKLHSWIKRAHLQFRDRQKLFSFISQLMQKAPTSQAGRPCLLWKIQRPLSEETVPQFIDSGGTMTFKTTSCSVLTMQALSRTWSYRSLLSTCCTPLLFSKFITWNYPKTVSSILKFHYMQFEVDRCRIERNIQQNLRNFYWFQS